MAGKKFLNGRISRFEFLTCTKEISLLIVLHLEKPLSIRKGFFQNIERQDMQKDI